MSFFDFFKRDIKESESRKVATYYQVGKAVTTPANYENFAKKGFAKNVIVYSAISKTAMACSGIKWLVYKKRIGGKSIELESHPLKTLMDRPNPMQSTSAFIESLVGFYRLTGNSYIEAARPNLNTPPLELWNVRPDRMRIIPAKNGYPKAFEYTYSGRTKLWEVDQIRFTSDIMHMKSFNPVNDWYGMAPLEAALLSLDQNNQSSMWNLALLQNSATPSGVLQVQVSDGNPRGTLTDETFQSLKEEFDSNHTGSQNAGRPLILEGGLDWKTIALSPKDMEFIQAKNLTAQDLALVFGVPAELLGLGVKTFNNYREAKLSFYEETILPIMDNLRDELNRWLAPAFGNDIYLDYDIDNIEALTYRREQKYTTVKDINFLTQNEKREFVGYEPKEGWDVFLVANQLIETPHEQEDIADEQKPVEDDTDEPLPESESPETGEKGEKSAINLLNNNEKQSSLRRQNNLKERYAKSFEKDLKKDFYEMNDDIIKAVKNISDPQLLQFQLAKVIDVAMKDIDKTLEFHIKKTASEFGLTVLGEAKNNFKLNIETKTYVRHFESFVDSYTKTRSGEAITTIRGTTQKRIKSIVGELTNRTILEGESNESFVKELTSTLNVESVNRARVIARTEVQLASNNASREAIRALEVPNIVKEWVSAQDDRVRDGHVLMNGETADLDEDFVTIDGNKMDGPGDTSAPAGEIINCRCVLVYKQKNQAND